MPRNNRTLVAGGLMAFTIAATALVHPGQQGNAPQGFPLSNTVRDRGVGVTGAFEGWYYDKDGSVNILVGYFNRNTKQDLDIPVGPNNRIEPGGPDRGQPTHFLPSRQYGVFAIRLPKDFGEKKLTWTLVANGQTNTITLHTKRDWVVEPFEDSGSKNTPPVLRFEPGGPTQTGPPRDVSASYSATVATPLALALWATDAGPKVNVNPNPPGGGRRGAASGFTPPPPLAVSWSLYRGPGSVTFSEGKPSIDKTDGKAITHATFTAPGDYILRVQANDQSGDGGSGFQCCWTNAHVAVTVHADSTTGKTDSIDAGRIRRR